MVIGSIFFCIVRKQEASWQQVRILPVQLPAMGKIATQSCRTDRIKNF